MLQWWTAAAPHGESMDPDTTGYVEPPETPAPVFAVRAFKHALFGTPQTAAPARRRDSNAENVKPESSIRDTKSDKNNSAVVTRGPSEDGNDLLASPAKGILMTPGTIGGKRKNVTFGVDANNAASAQSLKRDLPSKCPGTFPSPGRGLQDTTIGSEASDRTGTRSKLTLAFEKARLESAKPKVSATRTQPQRSAQDITINLDEPVSEAGRYWKEHYEKFQANSAREVKKLIMKQKATKSFAQARDNQCTALAQSLKDEQEKNGSLQARLSELDRLLEASQQHAQQLQREIDSLKRERIQSPPTSSRPAPSTARLQTTANAVAELVPQSVPVQQSRPRRTQSKAKGDDIWDLRDSSTCDPPSQSRSPVLRSIDTNTMHLVKGMGTRSSPKAQIVTGASNTMERSKNVEVRDICANLPVQQPRNTPVKTSQMEEPPRSNDRTKASESQDSKPPENATKALTQARAKAAEMRARRAG